MEPAPVPFERLFAHRDWVRRVARSLVIDESRAADLEQTVWLAALEHPPREERSLRGWLGTVLRNAAGKSRRSDERRDRREEAAPPPAAPARPDEIVAETEAHERVVRAVLALEEPYRTTVLLRYFEDLQPGEVAARMGVPVETVRTRLRRALEQVRARLDAEQGGDRKAWCLLLLPLARRASEDGELAPGRTPAGSPTIPGGPAGGATAAVLGGLLMGTAAKAAAAVVVVVVAGALLLRPGQPNGDAPSAAPPPAPRGTDSAAAPAAPIPAAAAAPAIAAPQDAAGFAAAAIEVVDVRGRPVAGAEARILEFARNSTEGIRSLSSPWPFSQVQPPAEAPTLSRAVCDASGRASLRAPRPGRWQVRVEAPGHRTAERSVWLRFAEPEAVRFVLRKGHSVTGVVKDPTGKPVAGAVVSADGQRWGIFVGPAVSRPTGADGAFRLDRLAEGLQATSVHLPRGIVHSGPTIRVPLASPLEIRLGGGVVVRGRVVDDSTDRPVAGASVAVEIAQGGKVFSGLGATTSGADGTFEVADLPPGDGGVRITAAAKGYRTRPHFSDREPTFRAEVSPGTVWEREVRLVPGEDPPRLPPELAEQPPKGPPKEPGSVEGIALDPDGAPAAGVTVTVWSASAPFGPGGETVTDGKGAFRFERIPAGKGSLYARPGKSGVGASTAFTLEGGQALRGLRLEMKRGGTISGRVIRSDGEPVAAPLLWAIRGGFAGDVRKHAAHFARDDALAPVNADGTFRLENQQAGNHLLTAWAEGCDYGTSEILVLADREEKTSVEIVLEPRAAGILAGRVTDPDGAPVARADLYALLGDRGDCPLVATSDAEGRFRVEGLDNRTVKVTVEAPGFERLVTEVSSGTQDLALVLERVLALSGRVVEQGTGKPIGGLPVRASPEPRPDGVPTPRGRWYATTAPDGTFRIEGVRGGTWSILAGSDGAGSSGGVVAKTVEGLLPGAEGIEILVAGGTDIRGTFVDSAGGPVKRWFSVQAYRRDADGGLQRVGAEVLSDMDGAFAVSGLETGAYDLEVRPGMNYSDDTPISLLVKGIEAGRAGLVVRIPRGARIRGRVANLPALPRGPRRPDLRIRGDGETWWPARSATVKEDGTFETEFLDPDRAYDLLANGIPDRMGSLRGVRPGPDEVVLELTEGLAISGRVVDEDGNAVGAGVPVTAWGKTKVADEPGTRAVTETRPDGSFLVRGLGEFRFVLAAGGNRSEFLPADADPAAEFAPGAQDVVLRVRRGLVQRGRLLDAKGRPAAGILVEARNGTCPQVYTAEDGTFALKGLVPGEAGYRIGDRTYGPFPVNDQELELKLKE